MVYDEEGYDYPVDDKRRVYVPLDPQTITEMEHPENTEKETKN